MGIVALVGVGIYAFDLLVVQPCRESLYLSIRYSLGARDRSMRVWQWHLFNNDGRVWFHDLNFLIVSINYCRHLWTCEYVLMCVRGTFWMGFA